MTVICRFAPSPTGFLHVGNIRAAIINYLYAKKNGGKFYLRLDDTDIQRVKNEYREMIFTDLNWLGLNYDLAISQSDRLAKYEEAKNKLILSKRLYECFETPEELHMQRKAQIASGIPPIYNRAALNLTKEQKENFIKQGIQPHYRFLLEDKEVSWNDKIKGKISYEGRKFSDPIVIRDNGLPTYTFCSVVDDIEHEITDIIRGEDHITNTAIQIQIFQSLGAKFPDFSHLALINAREGKISKREGGFDIKSLRNEGYEAMSIINLLSQIGASGNIEIYKNFDELINNFALSNFSKSATKYEISEVININQKLIQKLSFSDIKNRLENLEIPKEKAEKFWETIKANINIFEECKEWKNILFEELKFENSSEDKEFLKQISEFLPEDTSSENSWSNWLKKIKENSNRKGKNLFMPIRLSLTGKAHGPEIKDIINLISRNEIIKRLQN